MEQKTSSLCYICKIKASLYTCPRCNVLYCSLSCYKDDKHMDCSERFYKEWFIKEIKERRVPEAEKENILKTIQKVEEENPIEDFLGDEEGSQEISLEERLQGLDINDIGENQVDDLWCRLTPNEKEEFKSMTRNTNYAIDGLSKPWFPWWLRHNVGLVSEINEKSEVYDKLPEVLALKELDNKKSFSPLIGFNLINILYCYAAYQRLYNGCGPSDFVLEFSENCILSSDVLSANQTFNTADESLCSGMEKCTAAAKLQGMTVEAQFLIECISDVSHILTGPNLAMSAKYCCCCLSDLHRSLKKVRTTLKSPHDKQFCCTVWEEKDILSKLFRILKKLEFLIAWCNANQIQHTFLSMEVTEIYKGKLTDFKMHASLKQEMNCKLKSTPVNAVKKCLVEELGD